MRFVGIDPSVRGTAAVVIDVAGKVLARHYWADRQKDVKGEKDPNEAFAPMKVKLGDESRRVERLVTIVDRLEAFLRKMAPSFAAIEDYAVGAKDAHTRQLGEVGGAFRILMYKNKIPFRTHDPIAVKIFASDDAFASKRKMVEEVRDQWFDYFDIGKGDPDGASGNLADAHTLAEMLRTEVSIRNGHVDPFKPEFPERQRRIFFRVTRTQPTNVLERPFVIRE